jgi:hypothetical protein
MNPESVPVSNDGDYTPANDNNMCVNESSECIIAEPTSGGVSKPDDRKNAVNVEPVEAGTDTPVNESSDQKKSPKRLSGEYQQIKLHVEFSIQDDSEIESWEGDESKFSNSVEEKGTETSRHWIKTTV